LGLKEFIRDSIGIRSYQKVTATGRRASAGPDARFLPWGDEAVRGLR
jgi:hypothetical protein